MLINEQINEMLFKYDMFSEKGWRNCEIANSKLLFFGDSTTGESGIRTQGNVVFTSALIASDFYQNEKLSTETKKKHLDNAVKIISYLCKTHKTGISSCPSGGKWGLNWQSSWWTAKMAIGTKLIWEKIDPSLKEEIEYLVVSEAQDILNRYAPSGLFIDTKAEENAWDTEILASAMSLFPNHKLYDAWKQKMIEFCMNTFSCPQDRWNTTEIDGKQVKDWVYTTNVHSDFTLENHGAWHFCYYALPLSALSWSYFALKISDLEVPDALFHHYRDVWNRFKSTFLTTRFAYIAGKDWARYTYGPYFILPALMLIYEKFEDSTALFIVEKILAMLDWEQQYNSDGSFFGSRVTKGVYVGQSVKYETDCFSHLGLAYMLLNMSHHLKHKSITNRKSISLEDTHISQESGVVFTRHNDFFASFAWKNLTTDYPCLYVTHPEHDDMLEWQASNLIGMVTTFTKLEAYGVRTIKRIDDDIFICAILNFMHPKKGHLYDLELNIKICPGTHSVFIKSKAIAKANFVARFIQPLKLCIANDIFNNNSRTYSTKTKSTICNFVEKKPFILKMFKGRLEKVAFKVLRELGMANNYYPIKSNYVTVDNALEVFDMKENNDFVVTSPIYRKDECDSLHFDVLTISKPKRYVSVKKDQVLFDTDVKITINNRNK